MTFRDPLRVMVVDDHPVVRAGMVAILSESPGIEVVAACGDGAQALSRAAATDPQVILMDLRMPVMDGAEATARLTRAAEELGRPPPAIVVLTTFDDADIVRAVEAGARGYLLKDATPEVVVHAIRAAARGETVLAPPLAARLARARTKDPVELTLRERQVLHGVATGLSNAQIGRSLFIGESTVKTHLVKAFQKLGVNDRTAAVTTALRLGLIAPPPPTHPPDGGRRDG